MVDLDSKRGTGRTTRMLLAVAQYLATDPSNTATVVTHTSNWGWIRNFATGILSDDFVNRIKFQGYSTWQAQGIGKREYHFFDHHCFHNQVMQLRTELERLEQDFTKYD